MTKSTDILSTIAKAIPAEGNIGVAVSGGGDSLGLLVALAEISKTTGQQIEAMTVDHGLRSEAAEEAEYTRKMCLNLKIQHATARWTGWSGEGNLQGAARRGRYRLLAEWAKRRNLQAVCIGHTQDDVAETFIMRLARESGVDGLARMSPEFQMHDTLFLRPMLSISREDLREFLNARGVQWVEDPSNENEEFDRVRVRRALGVLNDLGIKSESLAAVSENLGQVRDVMRTTTAEFAGRIVEQEAGDLILNRDAFIEAPFELRRRLLNDMLSWVSDREYPLRRQTISELDEAIAEKRNFSCNGCLIQVAAKSFRILREFNAVREQVEFAPTWDRWRIDGPWKMGMKATALGEPAIAGVEDWRNAELPRQTLMASPAIWRNDELIAAPLAGFGKGWKVTLRQQDFSTYMAGSRITH